MRLRSIVFCLQLVALICDQCLSLCNQTFRNAFAEVSFDGEVYLQEHLNGCLENRPLKKVRVKGSLHALYSEAVSNMPQLSEIYFEGVSLYHICPNFIKNVPVLRMVSINYNPLSDIRENLFLNFELNGLNISSNMILNVERNSFKNVKLVHLDLSKNRLININKEAFNNSSIECLHLQHNNILALSKNVFDGIKNLRKIDLNYNNIDHIQDMTFKRFTNKENFYLHLQGNMLTKVNFLSETKLKYLDVSLNQISYLLMKNSTLVTIIRICPNPWNCKCLMDFWKFAKKMSMTIEEIARTDEEPVCIASSIDCDEDYNYDNVRQSYFKQVNYNNYWDSF